MRNPVISPFNLDFYLPELLISFVILRRVIKQIIETERNNKNLYLKLFFSVELDK